MAKPRVFLQGPLVAGPIRLSESQSRRLTGSHRLREGEPFLAFCGDGAEWSARLTSGRQRRATAELEEVVRREAPPPLGVEILCGQVRPSRMEWALEKCVEAGADIFRPLTSENSARGSAPSTSRTERWDRIAIEAAEQCGRVYPAVVGAPARLGAVLASPGTLVLCDRDGMAWENVARMLPSVGHVRLAVGPEGGFTAEEMAQARAAGAIVARLGPHTLRTETGAVAVTLLVRATGSTL
ncbi:MAG: RsmE family RNA methyltransferase [Dehalococcoidia bacterium]